VRDGLTGSALRAPRRSPSPRPPLGHCRARQAIPHPVRARRVCGPAAAAGAPVLPRGRRRSQRRGDVPTSPRRSCRWVAAARRGGHQRRTSTGWPGMRRCGEVMRRW